MPGFAPVELGLDAQTKRLIVQVTQDITGFHQPTQGRECLSDTIAGSAGGEALQHDMGRRRAGFQRSRDTDELVPLFGDRDRVGLTGSQTGEALRDLGAVEVPEALIGQILEPRHEIEAEQMTQAPQGLGESMGIGRMPLRVQASVVIEDAVVFKYCCSWVQITRPNS